MIRSVNGHALAYDDVGSGLPVVFLHGFPHDRSLWSSQLGAAALPTRCIAPDLRGFGESEGSATTIDDYASDVIALMSALGIVKAVVVGLSMGGYVAMAMWRRNPRMVRALVLVDTKATADTDEGRAKRTEQIAFAKARGSAALADALMPGMVGKATRAMRPDLTERIHGMLARASTNGVVGALTAMRDRPDSTPTLATITVPALIIVGDEDVLTPVSDARAMNAGIAGSRLEIVNGAGHLSNVERPAAFNHLLSEFLASLALT
ncbi:MAG TPA: alpha/beta hydrolase [Gemmatimonadaceae bacterium]|nr:alpha/beta hydrolase [Gemmatimonadaceae bacterium]